MEKKVIVEGESQNVAELSGEFPPVPISLHPPNPSASVTWKHRAQRLQKEVHVFYFVLKHPRTRWYSRLVAACSAAYILSPIQLIPSFIPVIGFLDDFLVLFLGAKLLKRITPVEVFAECRQLADEAEIGRREESRSVGAVVASVVIASVWLLLAIGASAIIASHIRR